MAADTQPAFDGLLAHARAHGERLELSGLTPLLLDDADALWVIEQGRIEVFTVAIEDGQAAGHRTHFVSIHQHELMFGMQIGAMGMGNGFLAVGKLGSVAWRLSWSALREAAQDPALAPVLARAVDTWVLRLSESLSRDIQPKPVARLNLKPGEAFDLPNGDKARAAQGVVWISPERGELLFLGLEDVDLATREALFPLASSSWVEAANRGGNDTRLHAAKGVERVAEDGYWEGLTLFHEALVNCEFINKRLAMVDEFNRLNEKAEHAERARHEAYQDIYSVLARDRGKSRDVEIAEGEHPFAAAARLVAASSGIEVSIPKGLEKLGTVQDRLHAISRESRFRVRPVALRDEWWRQDHGPFIAEREADKEPVAILPTGAGRYEYVVPASGARGQVDESFASALNPFGAVFYRPFPSGPMGALGLLRFGIRGLGRDVMTLVGMGLAVGLLGALTPLFTGQIFDQAIPEAERGMLAQFGIALLIAALVSTVFNFTQQIAALRIQGKMDYAIQAAVWDRLLNLPATFFSDYSAGDLADRAAGVNAIRGLLAGAGVSAILGSLSSLFFVGLMFYYSPRLALVAMALTAVFVGVSFAGNLMQIRLQRENLQYNGKLAGLVLQLLSGVSKLRTSGSESHAFRVWSRLFADSRRLSLRIGGIQNGVTVFNSVFPVLSSIALFTAVAGIAGGPAGGMSTGEFIAFNAAYGAFLNAMVALSDASLGLLRAIPLYERLQPIIASEPETDGSRESPGELSGAIELSHVHFRYTADGPWIIRDLSLKIRAGEFIAFVGGSGSGKSTVMRLIVGFERPEKGSIYCDGKDLASLDLREVRQQMGVVLQDSQVLPTDIFRNIVGTSSRTVEEAWEAARKVGLDEDVKAMPMGMHTYVMEGGGGFSGGQKQRLLLARAVVHNPRIILLDEATSALDNRTQAQVTASTERMQATRIVIAHRLSTIIRADRICMLHQGQIAEMGSYEELMALDGLFAQLAKRQLA